MIDEQNWPMYLRRMLALDFFIQLQPTGADAWGGFDGYPPKTSTWEMS
jgi:hypothetical protein